MCIGLEGIKWSRFVAERWLDRPQDKPTETGNASRSKTHSTQFLCHRSLRASQRSSPLCPLPAVGATLGGWDYGGSTNYQGFCRITRFVFVFPFLNLRHVQYVHITRIISRRNWHGNLHILSILSSQSSPRDWNSAVLLGTINCPYLRPWGGIWY